MKREILINATQRETRVAILEDDELVELLVDRPDAGRMVGDICLGRVDAVLPGLQAVFVDIGTDKSAFLHASDLVYPDAAQDDDDDDAEETFRELDRDERDAPPIEDVLKKGQELLVQVSKEPISTKGPRVTAQVSMAGRFLVYMPFASRVGVSRKIGDREERKRLRALVEGMLPEDSGGVIVRTVGEDVTPDTIERELQTLMNAWKRVKKKTHFVRPPSLVHRETSLTRGLIRDIFSDKDTRANRDRVLQELRQHLSRDRARTKAFAVSDLGLIEMTRQRVRQSHLQSMTEACPTCHGTGRVFTAEAILRRMERSVKRIGIEGRRDPLLVKLHPDVAMHAMENESDLMRKLEKAVGFSLEVRDDPLLRPDEFKLVVKRAGRDVTQQYAVA